MGTGREHYRRLPALSSEGTSRRLSRASAPGARWQLQSIRHVSILRLVSSIDKNVVRVRHGLHNCPLSDSTTALFCRLSFCRMKSGPRRDEGQLIERARDGNTPPPPFVSRALTFLPSCCLCHIEAAARLLHGLAHDADDLGQKRARSRLHRRTDWRRTLFVYTPDLADTPQPRPSA